MTCSASPRKRGAQLMMALAFLALTAVAALADYDNTPIVVFRVDDHRASWRQPFAGLGGVTGLVYGKQKQIPITWAVVSDWASDPTWDPLWSPLKWYELTDYVTVAGGELASHSKRHQPETTQQDYINQVVQSKADIEAHVLGCTCKTFIQPGVWTGEAYLDLFQELNQPIAQAIQQTYAQSQAYLGYSWVIGSMYYRYGMTSSMPIDQNYQPSVDAIRSTLDVVAATPGCIFEFMGHGVQESGGTAGSYIRADVLKALMDRLAELRDQGKIRLMTIDQAYHATMDPGLNRLSDGDLEVVTPGSRNPVGPVTLQVNATIAPDGGVNNSRCALLPPGQSNGVYWHSYLPPGRYKLTWWQKHESASGPPKSVQVGFMAYGAGNPTLYPVYYKSVACSSLNTWEQKCFYSFITYGNPDSIVVFRPGQADSTFRIDGATVTLEPLDPGTAPTGTTATVDCSQFTISWLSPPDPTVTTINIRYGDRACPIAPDQDGSVASLPAVPGTQQSVTTSLPPSSTGRYYFSVFAVKGDGNYTGPDLARIKVDDTPPTTPQVNVTVLPNGDVHAYWSSSDPESGICQYRYGVGTSCGSPNVLPWTTTTDTCATITGLPIGELNLLVQAKNNAGSWSSTTCSTFGGLSTVFAWPDGTSVAVRGTVSAAFADCGYVQNSIRTRGIKLVGDIDDLVEGTEVTVQGILTTVNGERAVTVD